MKASIKRVLPTPVARAKHSEGNSRSKSVTEGNSLAIASSAPPRSSSLPGGNFRNSVEDLQRPELRGAQAEAACNRVNVLVHCVG